MTLRCELFGQAGDYALTLRPAASAGPQDLAVAFIKVCICSEVTRVPSLLPRAHNFPGRLII